MWSTGFFFVFFFFLTIWYNNWWYVFLPTSLLLCCWYFCVSWYCSLNNWSILIEYMWKVSCANCLNLQSLVRYRHIKLSQVHCYFGHLFASGTFAALKMKKSCDVSQLKDSRRNARRLDYVSFIKHWKKLPLFSINKHSLKALTYVSGGVCICSVDL